MNRGSVHCARREKHTSGGFNEAPIHESGKSFCGCATTAIAAELQ